MSAKASPSNSNYANDNVLTFITIMADNGSMNYTYIVCMEENLYDIYIIRWNEASTQCIYRVSFGTDVSRSPALGHNLPTA